MSASGSSSSGGSGVRDLLAFPFRVCLYVPDPETTIADGYDQIAIERSEDGGATFTELSDDRLPIKLDEDTLNYFYLDLEGEEGYLYQPVLQDSSGVEAPIPQTPRQGIDSSFEQILTIDELKSIYLFGIDLTDDQNREFPDELFIHYILEGINEIEHEVDCNIIPKKFVERYDFWIREYEHYMFVQLNHRPLIQVTSLSLEYPSGEQIIDFPLDWVRQKNRAAQIEVLPARGTFTQLLVSAGGGFLPLVFGGSDYIPDIIRVEYNSGFLCNPRGLGFAGSTSPQILPTLMKGVIGKKAAFGPLNTAGDLIVGAGIASRSISIDGLSESIATTSSATNAGYGARIGQYERELKTQLPILRRSWKGVDLTVA